MSQRSDRAERVRDLAEKMRISESTARAYLREWEGPEPKRKVYFITRGEPKVGVPVKIGLAINPWKRMDDLQIACAEPLTMFLFLRGNRKLELQLHRRFAKDHVRGEWFTFSIDMIRYAHELTTSEKRRRETVLIGGRHLAPAQRRGLEPLPDPLPAGVEVLRVA